MSSEGQESGGEPGDDRSPAVLALAAAVAAVQAQPPADLPGTVALADTRELLRLGEVLRAVTLSRVSDVERRELHTLDGASSAGAWVRSQPVSAGRTDLALARRLTRMPHVEQAVLAGRLDLTAAAQLGAALDKAAKHLDRREGHPATDDRDGGSDAALAQIVVEGVLQIACEAVGGLEDDDPALAALLRQLVEIAGSATDQGDRFERTVVLLATLVPRSMLAAGLDRLLDALSPEDLEHRVETAHDRRAFTLTRNADGSGYTISRGQLSLELGEYLQAVLTAARSTDPANVDDSEARRRLHDEPTVDNAGHVDSSGDSASGRPADRPLGLPYSGPSAAELALGPRTRAQRDHDALLLALRTLLDSGALGVRGKVAPHIAVTVSLEAAHGEPGALPATTSTGSRLPASLLNKLLCDSRLTRVVMSLGGRVMEVSHSERTAKPHERLALSLAWGHRCAEAGCPCPQGTPLIPHHVEPHSKSGVTALADTVMVCPTTHDHIHVRGRTITLRDGRRIGPNGWVSTRPADVPDSPDPGPPPDPDDGQEQELAS